MSFFSRNFRKTLRAYLRETSKQKTDDLTNTGVQIDLESEEKLRQKRKKDAEHNGPVPPHLKGRQVGLWYARQNASRKRTKYDMDNPKEIVLTHTQKTACEDIHRLLNSDQIPNSRHITPETLNTKEDAILDGSKEYKWYRNNQPCDPMMLNAAMRQKQSRQYMQHLRTRRELPAYQLFDSLIWPTIQRNQVTVLAGATGCGKTTGCLRKNVAKRAEKAEKR